ncbi:hypothetical protein ILYODFUR_009803 [Ilyodon furcidens]|uniref:Uncharacterized protein n=1 Tax=Ilyodon furcidens TaxID=33524 RepID=A0ABV0T9I1_9TELE
MNIRAGPKEERCKMSSYWLVPTDRLQESMEQQCYGPSSFLAVLGIEERPSVGPGIWLDCCLLIKNYHTCCCGPFSLPPEIFICLVCLLCLGCVRFA